MHARDHVLRLVGMYSRSAEGTVRPRSAWLREFGIEITEALTVRNILAPTMASAVAGETIRYDFGEGLKTYRVESTSKAATAWPEDGIGRAYSITDDVKLLRLDYVSALRLLAEENGGALDPLPDELHPWLAVVRRHVGTTRVVFVFVLDYSRLWLDGAALAIEHAVHDISAHVRIIVDRGGAKASAPYLHMRSPEVILVEECTGFFRVPRYSYCHPRLGISAQDATSVYSERPIVVDRVNEAMFFFGRKIAFRARTKAFAYLQGICSLGEQEVPLVQFCAQSLGQHVDDVAASSHVREARHQAKKRIEKEFKEHPTELAALKARFIQEHPWGQLKRSFPAADVLVWDNSHAIP
jgi:hypothetical protein